MAGTGEQFAHGASGPTGSVRTDARASRLSSRSQAPVRRFRPLGHPGQSEVFRPPQLAARASAPARMVWPNEQNQIYCHPRQRPNSQEVKNYILDTNVLLHDPNSLLSFRDNNVLMPIEVIEEIDRFKRESSELGQNARSVSSTLDALRTQGLLNEGVRLSTGACLRIILHSAKDNGHSVFGNNTVDSRIVTLAQAVQKQNAKIKTIVVSKDINLRVKANALGLEAEDYENDRI